jgi:hypothetical protein
MARHAAGRPGRHRRRRAKAPHAIVVLMLQCRFARGQSSFLVQDGRLRRHIPAGGLFFPDNHGVFRCRIGGIRMRQPAAQAIRSGQFEAV